MGKGPFSLFSVSYKCHPDSILAVMDNSNRPVSISFKFVSQLTGLNICALENEKSNRPRTVRMDFINYVLFK
tara:strand:+ start:213 stop:428 length:216 start_codon:yes stop_codon:yes gene_type:complete